MTDEKANKSNPCPDCNGVKVILCWDKNIKYAECKSCGRHIRTNTILSKNEPIENEEQR